MFLLPIRRKTWSGETNSVQCSDGTCVLQDQAQAFNFLKKKKKSTFGWPGKIIENDINALLVLFSFSHSANPLDLLNT